jgi:hypothetical protein
MALYTPTIGTIPTALQDVPMSVPTGTPISVLADTSDNNLNDQLTFSTINPQGKMGVTTDTIQSGSDTVTFNNSGELIVDGVNEGNISSGSIAPITLKDGATVGVDSEIDSTSANGTPVMAPRLYYEDGDFKMTAALRQPSGATPYLDLNFQEETPGAAANATGYEQTDTGVTDPTTGKTLQVSIPELLSMNENTPLFKALQ